MSKTVVLSKSENIGLLLIDSPPVNAIGHEVRKDLMEGLEVALADDDVEAIVIGCEGRTFIAGADIAELGGPFGKPDFNDVLQALENARCPIIAAMHGTPLGGGLETAMACDYRIATAGTRVGLPEVHLGIIPGAGGTQRLPRLVGVEDALRMITSGRPIPVEEAFELGLVDKVIEGELELTEVAIAFAKEVVEQERGKCLVRDRDIASEKYDAKFFSAAREAATKQSRGLMSPLSAIEAVNAAVQLPFDEGIAREAEIFSRCVTSDQSTALRYLFFAERKCAKIADVPEDTPVKEIASAGILGAGTMGSGIAMNFANAGIPVSILDSSAESLERALATIEENFLRMAEKGRITEQDVKERMSLIRPVQDYDAFAEANIIIEAVFEDMALKKEVFKQLDKIARPDAILATNTSMLDIGEIAAQTSRPENVIGLHFFSPANIMKLVEVVRSDTTAKETISTSMALVKAMKKVGVLVKVCDGFVGNRMVFPYVREGCFLLEEGALPQQVDGALTKFGFAMGPHAMCDMAGQDVFWLIRQRQAESRPANARYSKIQDLVCDQKRFGLKSGAGIYRYEKGSRVPLPDPEIELMIMEESKASSIKRREISDEEIVERCVYALVNEGAKILEEEVALRASDIDIVYLYGYGFPGFRGGPMYYADSIGLKKVYDRICDFAKQEPELWEPSQLLKKLAESGGRFSDE